MAAVNFGPGDALADRSKIRLRIICVPQAGMGAWAFHGWQKAMPPGIEVLPVEPPGRNSRMNEPKPTSMGELVRGLATGLQVFGAFDLPYVLFGHSLGGSVAFELIAEQERRGGRTPSLFIVSGVRPPHLAGAVHDADTVAPALAPLAPAEFWKQFERRYGVNPDLDDDRVREMARHMTPYY